MTKKIKFNPIIDLVELSVPCPKPAENYFPDWFKNAMPFFTKKPEFDVNTGRPNTTFKMCMPFTDSFSMGYIQETWTDIWIEKKDDGTYFYFPAGPKIMSERSSTASSLMPAAEGFLSNHYTWHPPWMPELPAGYSCILTHPFNHYDLPFQTFTGVIDSDGFYSSEQQSNIPFLLKDNFTGLIKKGTPMYQIIPFKRENWESAENKYDLKKQLSVTQRVRQHLWGGYKKLFWNKKNFT
jgi:hypothetical protein